jgi:hypothetical protein
MASDAGLISDQPLELRRLVKGADSIELSSPRRSIRTARRPSSAATRSTPRSGSCLSSTPSTSTPTRLVWSREFPTAFGRRLVNETWLYPTEDRARVLRQNCMRADDCRMDPVTAILDEAVIETIGASHKKWALVALAFIATALGALRLTVEPISRGRRPVRPMPRRADDHARPVAVRPSVVGWEL